MHFRRATQKDIVGELLYQAATELNDYVFKFEQVNPIDFISYDLERGDGIFGFKSLFVSEEDGKVVATLTAYCGKKYNRVLISTLISALLFYGPVKFLIVVFRILRTAKYSIPPAKDAVHIANGYVLPEYRYPGVFSSLVECGENLARANHLNKLECDVSYRNERSYKVHQFLGFRVTHEIPYDGDHPLLDGTRRMTLTI